MPVFTEDEIKQHNSEEDAWIVYNGSVYDVTKFASLHPGGKEILLEHAGKDVSSVMKQEDIHLHSEAAFSLLDTYKIGNTADYKDKDDEFELKGWKEETVDWDEGLVLQVHKYGHEYVKWVHSPVDKKLKLFQSQFLEFFSKTPWYLVPLVWLPVVIGLAYISFTNLQDNELVKESGYVIQSAFLSTLMVTGVFIWTLVEYVLHRFLFHLMPPGDSKFWITMHFFLHGQHHKVPFDPGRLVFPPVAASAFAVPFYLFFVSILPLGIGQGIYAGGLLGYVIYDTMHYYLHHGQPEKGSYLYRLKQYHLHHHFTNQSKGFGISSKFWDMPFGTELMKEE
eukprot:Seg3980.1 transcript_id=Seg3980.1/GoldUCD/mRNA.D3Y31 product="Fatty acid 2-hydroxylase" protein_id=Seg3980.1/GoldUCD/D3Y31